MLGSLSDLRARFRARLASGSTLERIGLLAGTFFLLYLLVDAAAGALPAAWTGGMSPQWSPEVLFFAAVGSLLWGAAMHAAEKSGFFSFDPAD